MHGPLILHMTNTKNLLVPYRINKDYMQHTQDRGTTIKITQHDPSPEGHEEQQETLIIIIRGNRGAIPHT